MMFAAIYGDGKKLPVSQNRFTNMAEIDLWRCLRGPSLKIRQFSDRETLGGPPLLIDVSNPVHLLA
jgi:hypothetical protein